MQNKSLEAEQQKAKNLVANLETVLKTLKENPENPKSKPKLTKSQVNDFMKKAKEEFHKRGILKLNGTIGQNRSACVEYLTAVIPFVIDEYFRDDSEHKGDMKNFLDRFCFCPDNHQDRFCLASYLQKKGLLDEHYRPISEESEDLLISFEEETDYSPYEKAPEYEIEEFLNNYCEENSDDFFDPFDDEEY